MAPLEVRVSDAATATAYGGIALVREGDDSSTATLGVVSSAPTLLTVALPLGAEGVELLRMLEGESIAPSLTGVSYTTHGGQDVLRRVETVQLAGALEEAATLTVVLGPVEASGDTVAAPEVVLTISGRLDVMCSCGTAVVTDGPGAVNGACPDMDAWCASRRAVLGLD